MTSCLHRKILSDEMDEGEVHLVEFVLGSNNDGFLKLVEDSLELILLVLPILDT